MEKEILENYIKAGKIASEVREESKKLIKPGESLLKISETIEELIRKKGGEPAFPVNISLNNIAAHYTPAKNDVTIIKESDVVKIDLGVHIDGYIGDTACTIIFDSKHEKLKEASEKALEEAIKICRPGVLLSDISEKIEATIKSFGFKPVANLTGHGLDAYNLHAEPQIPNIKFRSDYKLKEDQVIAIEPFATDGLGLIKESEPTLIFAIHSGAVRNQDARKIIKFGEKFNGLPCAERWIPIESLFKIKIALRELRERNIIYDYPVLKEVENGLISQAEHTIIIKDEPIITTK